MNQPVSIAGKPADYCPFCGELLRVNRTDSLPQQIVRYMTCERSTCKAVMLSTQPKAVLIRVVTAPVQIPYMESQV